MTSFTPGYATRTRSGPTPSRSTTSRPVYSELTKTRSAVRAVFAYLAPCIEAVFGVTHSGKRSGTRSWTVVARTPPAWGGYIQSE